MQIDSSHNYNSGLRLFDVSSLELRNWVDSNYGTWFSRMDSSELRNLNMAILELKCAEVSRSDDSNPGYRFLLHMTSTLLLLNTFLQLGYNLWVVFFPGLIVFIFINYHNFFVRTLRSNVTISEIYETSDVSILWFRSRSSMFRLATRLDVLVEIWLLSFLFFISVPTQRHLPWVWTTYRITLWGQTPLRLSFNLFRHYAPFLRGQHDVVTLLMCNV